MPGFSARRGNISSDFCLESPRPRPWHGDRERRRAEGNHENRHEDFHVYVAAGTKNIGVRPGVSKGVEDDGQPPALWAGHP
jgi:hypothetical protein